MEPAPAPSGFIPYIVSKVALWTGVTDPAVQTEAQAIILAGIILSVLYFALVMMLALMASFVKQK